MFPLFITHVTNKLTKPYCGENYNLPTHNTSEYNSYSKNHRRLMMFISIEPCGQIFFFLSLFPPSKTKEIPGAFAVGVE